MYFSGEQILESLIICALILTLFTLHPYPRSPILGHYYLIINSWSVIHECLDAHHTITPHKYQKHHPKYQIQELRYQVWHPKYQICHTFPNTMNTLTNTKNTKFQICHASNTK